MKRLFKSRKALSPVVAAIILIAVTVAVSIAVAAWMGALTFTFMDTELLEIQGVAFNAGNANVTLTVLNPGTSDSTVSKYKIGIDGIVADLASEVYIAHGGTETVTVPLAWVSGVMYDIYVITSNAKQSPYRARAP